ncbi:MAG: GNAT family N-acetyltransferase [Acidobacteria bacterium]|nr:GNAT family N-acetyltransferase [Acidobacteriota bacterium]
MTEPAPFEQAFLRPGDPRWEAALGRAPHDLFHLPGYLQAACDHEGGSPVALYVATPNAGMLIPLILRPLESFGPEFKGFLDATSPYGYPSPLFWGEPALGPALVDAAWDFLATQQVVSIFLRLNPFLPHRESAFEGKATVCGHGLTVYMDLTNPEESWHNINSANRQAISKLHRLGHTVSFDDWSKYDDMIEAYTQTMHRLKASPFYFFPKSYFEALREALPGTFHLATTLSPEGHVTGGLVFSEVGGLIQYFLTGSMDKYASISPAKLFLDGLRRWGIERGHHTLNMGGGVGASQDDGLFQFKSRFSKHTRAFRTLRRVLLPDTYEALARSSGVPTEDPSGFFPVYRRSV